ncbi:MAG: CinA family nicotinamide mononucleotide deamidase-related protein [Blastopirellula sp. JB062]
MRAEIVAVGDELTSGQRLDTNSQWLSRQLGDLGIAVGFHTTVSDELGDMVASLKIAADRADIILVSGGLGPTADDLTREAIAQAFDRPLALDSESLAHLERRFAARGTDMPERNRVQAYFPAGSQVIANPNGTAPGIDLAVEISSRQVRLFALPGVPIELKEMWLQTVGPTLVGLGGRPNNVIRHYELKCFGVGESRLEAMLPDMIRRGRDPQVGITVHQATITLRVTVCGIDDEECRRKSQPTIDEIRRLLGPLVFGETGDELQDAVGRMLVAKQRTVACIESASAGMLALSLSETPHAAGRLAGGRIAPSWREIAEYLQSDVADEVAAIKLAAEKIRRELQADYGLATGPINESGGYVLAVADANGAVSESSQTLGHPEIHRPRAAKQALDLLRRRMLSQDPP